MQCHSQKNSQKEGRTGLVAVVSHEPLKHSSQIVQPPRAEKGWIQIQLGITF